MIETVVMAESVQQEEQLELQTVDQELLSSTPSKDDKPTDENVESEEPASKSFDDMEANLDECLKAEAEKNRPKRKTIAELLKSVPGYGQILDKRPIIRPTSKLEIDFNEDSWKNSKDDPKKKGIEDLMNRFKIHTAVAKPEKKQHFKIHIAKNEEDSQGVNHITVDEVDYVKLVSTEEQEQQENTSPHTSAPGVKMSQMKSKLLADIRAKRALQYEEKLKAHAMYSEEKDLDDKKEGEEEEEEEEILEDEISDESNGEESEDEVDENQEENVETLLDADPQTKKKSRKRLAFFEDEADESDQGDRSVDEDEDKLDEPDNDDLSFIDDRPVSDDDDNDVIATGSEAKEQENNNSEKFEYNMYSSQDFFNDHKSQDDVSLNKETQSDYNPSQDLFSDVDDIECKSQTSKFPSFLDPNKASIVSASLLTHRSSPVSPRFSIFHNPTSSTPSSLFPRMNSDAALDAFCEDRTPVKTKIPLEVAKLVGTQEPSASDIDDELEGICSAKFPSQPPATPSESQEFRSFGFDNEDDLIESKEIATPNNNVMFTPSMHESSTDVKTPKIVERNRIESKRLNFQNLLEVAPVVKDHSAADDQADDEDDNEGNVITTKVQRKRKRVLKFSDDEDSNSDASDEEDESMEVDDDAVDERIEQEAVDESDVDSNIEYDENEEEIPKFKGLVSGKTGMLRKEFVDAEAELSGDEVGSADEDERGLDELELEACDDADMDEEALRNQVGKAHLKLLLDDDQREIRYLQDVYLEQGDLYSDGKGRERQFKWKNIDNYDAEEPLVNGEEGDVEIVEDETEAKRQKDRLEKIKWIKEHSQTEEIRIETDPDENSQIFLKDSQFLKLTDNTLRKIQSVSSLTAPVDGTTKGVGLSKRGSFLLREPSSISRLAEMTKINDSVAKVKNKLVFTVITPPSDTSKSTDPTRKQYRRQPKKNLKVDPSLEKVDQPKPSATLFKWIK